MSLISKVKLLIGMTFAGILLTAIMLHNSPSLVSGVCLAVQVACFLIQLVLLGRIQRAKY
jgi:hypothetical protein